MAKPSRASAMERVQPLIRADDLMRREAALHTRERLRGRKARDPRAATTWIIFRVEV